MSKLNYDQPKKRELQKEFFKNITEENFVGLCGPTPKGYLEVINWRRFNKIYLFESNEITYLAVKDTLSEYPNVQVILGDIIKRLDIKNAFYDFDFCKSIFNDEVDTVMHKIKKMNACSLTFCVRGKSAIITNAKMRQYFPKYNYISEVYKDGAPMICYKIFNPKNKE